MFETSGYTSNGSAWRQQAYNSSIAHNSLNLSIEELWRSFEETDVMRHRLSIIKWWVLLIVHRCHRRSRGPGAARRRPPRVRGQCPPRRPIFITYCACWAPPPRRSPCCTPLPTPTRSPHLPIPRTTAASWRDSTISKVIPLRLLRPTKDPFPQWRCNRPPPTTPSNTPLRFTSRRNRTDSLSRNLHLLILCHLRDLAFRTAVTISTHRPSHITRNT